MSAKGNVKVSILGDASDLNHATSEASAHIEEFSKKTKESFAKVKEAGKLLAEIGGLSALTFGLKDVTEEAVKAEAEQKKLANTVKDAGLSWKAHSSEIDEWLDKTSRASGFAKSDLSASLGNLVRTTGNVKDAQKLSNEAMDVARSKGVGLANAQSLLARVYNGSYTGLKRLGLQVKPVTTAQDALAKSSGKVTDAQKKHAKALDQTATRTKALQLVQQKFGGQSAAYAKSTAGSFERAKQSLDLFEEQVGNLVLPLMAKAANAVSSVADAAAKEWPKIAPTVKQVFSSVKTDILTVVTAVKGLVTGFQQGKTSATAIAGAIGGLAVAAIAAKAFNVLKTAIGGVSTAFKLLKVALLANPFTAVAIALAALGAVLVTAYKTNDQFRAKVQAAWAWIKTNTGPVFTTVKNAVIAAFTAIKTAVGVAIKFVQDWITKNRANIIQFGQAWVNIGKFIGAVVKTYITGLLIPELKILWAVIQAGWTLVKAAWPGIQKAIESAVKVISGVIAVFTGVFTGDWSKAWNGAKEIVSGTLGTVEGLLNAAVGVLGKAAGAVGDAIKNALVGAFDGVVGAIKGVLNGVIGVYNLAIDAINNATPGAIKVAGHTIVPGIPDIPHIPTFAAGGVVVPGSDRQDGTWVRASGGETVFTYDGQAIINMVGAAAGVPNLVGMALANQAPHFAAGGIIGNAYTQGYDVGAQGGSLSSVINDIISKSLLGEPHKRKSKTQAAGGASAPGDAPSGVRAMLSRATAIAGRGLPYVYGGGHGAFSTQLGGYDCSGYVSNILGPSVLSSTMAVRQPLQGALQAGDGKWVTVGIRGSSGQNAHTMIRIGNSYFESGGQHGPARVGGWDGAFDHFHPKGYRAGGRIPKIIRSLEHAGRTSVKGLLAQLARAASSEGISQPELFAAQTAIRHAMSQTGNTKAGGRGLRGALSLVQGEQGRRIGADVGSIDTLTSEISDQTDILDLTQQAEGLDTSSAQAIGQRLTQDRTGLKQLQTKKKQLQKTLQTAKKTKNKKLVRNVSAAIKGIDKSILGQRASITGDRSSIAALAPTQDDFLNAAASEATLTDGLGDDRAAAAAIQQSAAAKLQSARAGGDPRAIAEAAQNLKTASDNLASIDEQLKQQAYSSNDAKQSLDKLAEVQGDPDAKKRELADLEERKKLDEANLEQAKQTNDPAKIAEAADRETQTIQAINDLNDNLSQANALAQQQADLNKTIADNQSKLLAIAGQGDQILTAVIAAVSGGIGGKAGLGFQSPSFAGQVARY